MGQKVAKSVVVNTSLIHSCSSGLFDLCLLTFLMNYFFGFNGMYNFPALFFIASETVLKRLALQRNRPNLVAWEVKA